MSPKVVIGSDWLEDVRRCVAAIDRDEFRLGDVYIYESELAAAYPNNDNVRAKIRQQLQRLRDLGELEFVDNSGTYRKLPRG